MRDLPTESVVAKYEGHLVTTSGRIVIECTRTAILFSHRVELDRTQVKVTVKVLVKICYTRTQVGYTGPPFSKEHCASIMVGRQVHTHKQLTFIVCYVDHSSIREEQAI
jgi:hypothetical protein